MQFETERLRVRFCEERDCALITHYLQDETVAGPLGVVPIPFKQEHALDFYQSMKPLYATKRPELFTIADRTTDALIGIIGLHPEDSQKDPDIAIIGYWLGRPFWKKGYITEVTPHIIELAFTQMGWREIVGYTNTDNSPSQNVLKKLGFTDEGHRVTRPDVRGTPFESVFRLTSQAYFSTKAGE